VLSALCSLMLAASFLFMLLGALITFGRGRLERLGTQTELGKELNPA